MHTCTFDYDGIIIYYSSARVFTSNRDFEARRLSSPYEYMCRLVIRSSGYYSDIDARFSSALFRTPKNPNFYQLLRMTNPKKPKLVRLAVVRI